MATLIVHPGTGTIIDASDEVLVVTLTDEEMVAVGLDPDAEQDIVDWAVAVGHDIMEVLVAACQQDERFDSLAFPQGV